jgi:DNA-binding transcriptional ArsR family regulator
LTVTALASRYDMSLNAVSKHIKTLERAGLIRREVRGREHYCQLDATRLEAAAAWMDRYQKFWTICLDALEKHLMEKRKRGKQ